MDPIARTQALLSFLCDFVASNPHRYLKDLDPLFMGGIIEKTLAQLGQQSQVLQLNWEDSRGSPQCRAVAVYTEGEMFMPYQEPSLDQALRMQNPEVCIDPTGKFASPYIQPDVLDTHIKKGTDLEEILNSVVQAGVSFCQGLHLDETTRPASSHSSMRRTL